MEEAQRLQRLPMYVFAQLDMLKAEERKKGMDLIDLGMGNPDLPPPSPIIDALTKALHEPSVHRYPGFEGLPEFREAVADWCQRQYGISINPENEVLPLIGSKEGLIHFAFAFVNPGDITLVPMPAYPAHFRGTLLAGGEPHVLATSERYGYIPDLDTVDESIARKARILFLSYPTNPTAATATREFFEEAVEFAKKYELILVHDFAYAELYFEKKDKPISMLSVDEAKDICIEFHTLSKTFSMPGWRIGFAVGNSALIASLHKIKTNLDYGLFTALQKAAIAALNINQEYIENMRATYKRRRDIFVEGLKDLGWPIEKPKATMYVWIPVPKGYTSTHFAVEVLKKTGVVIAPGVSFGDLGEGYVRIALVEKEERLKEALKRMKEAGIKYHGSS